MTVCFSFFRDRKRKNYVGEDGNVKKLRTESGVRIPATYKKNMYPVDIIRQKILKVIFPYVLNRQISRSPVTFVVTQR